MKNLLGTNKFKFLLTGERFKDNDFEPTIVSVNFPSISLGMVMQPNPIRSMKRPSESFEYDPLMIEFLIQEDMSDWLTIYDWLTDMRDPKKQNSGDIYTDASLVLMSNKNNPNIIFKFEDIYPSELSSFPLTNNSDNQEPIICTATFNFLKMHYITTL